MESSQNLQDQLVVTHIVVGRIELPVYFNRPIKKVSKRRIDGYFTIPKDQILDPERKYRDNCSRRTYDQYDMLYYMKTGQVRALAEPLAVPDRYHVFWVTAEGDVHLVPCNFPYNGVPNNKVSSLCV